ncbi:TPM domain-containing protein [Phenylobacterium sp.]|uniref:TPM domain-containing protein n=1 Tax=Phenylobacterium sp. TaxID=1871053 RepID=UPI00286A55D9|nr:TPM domain-containing protein [Phenylobacterium sp.]
MSARIAKCWTLGLLVLAALFAGSAALAAAPSFPPLDGRVVDQANILTPQTRADLTTKLEALEAKTSRQLVVVTVPSLQGQNIEDYGYQLGRAWGIGEKKRDTGVLLIGQVTARAQGMGETAPALQAATAV